MTRWKYPRTPHLPWSPGATADDVRLADDTLFVGRDVVVTEKLDGENTTIYPDGTLHARSLTGASHPSQSWARRYAAQLAPQLLAGWRVCGENLYARHALAYDALPSYFVVFSLWDDQNMCRSWDETVAWRAQFGAMHAPVLYAGRWDRRAIQALLLERGRPSAYSASGAAAEGAVVRLAGAFPYDAFGESCAKFVYPPTPPSSSVLTAGAPSRSWRDAPVTPNQLAAPERL
ncbi:MAG TPA: RNA ligase family protein [Ktedonobacterales bacterium]|nr:RNA ligase family protein [Ktedonobacterales bacterium]